MTVVSNVFLAALQFRGWSLLSGSQQIKPSLFRWSPKLVSCSSSWSPASVSTPEILPGFDMMSSGALMVQDKHQGVITWYTSMFRSPNLGAEPLYIILRECLTAWAWRSFRCVKLMSAASPPSAAETKYC